MPAWRTAVHGSSYSPHPASTRACLGAFLKLGGGPFLVESSPDTADRGGQGPFFSGRSIPPAASATPLEHPARRQHPGEHRHLGGHHVSGPRAFRGEGAQVRDPRRDGADPPSGRDPPQDHLRQLPARDGPGHLAGPPGPPARPRTVDLGRHGSSPGASFGCWGSRMPGNPWSGASPTPNSAPRSRKSTKRPG